MVRSYVPFGSFAAEVCPSARDTCLLASVRVESLLRHAPQYFLLSSINHLRHMHRTALPILYLIFCTPPSAYGGSAMTFEEILDQAIAMLQRRGRVTYRLLKRQFQLDDDTPG